MNEAKMFDNQGSPEQIKEGEKRMTEDEMKSSEMRENVVNKLQEAGIRGEIYLFTPGPMENAIMKGNIDGHEINLDFTKGLYSIDGKRIEGKSAEKIYKAYYKFGIVGDNYNNYKYIENAQENIARRAVIQKLNDEKKAKNDEAQILVDEIMGKIEK
jgi:hypothetical protein